LDLDGNVQMVWNPAAEKMLGWTAQEAMGHPLPSVPMAGQDEFTGFREKIRRGLTLDGVEVRRQMKDGTPIDYSIYASPLRDAEGRIAGNIAVLVDITERKQMVQALRDSEQHLRAVVNGSSMPQFVIGRDHRIIYWNRAMEEYSGLRAEEMVGTTEPWRAFYKSERPCLVDLLVEGERDKIEQLYAGKYTHSRLIEDAVEAVDFFPDMHGGVWLSFTAAIIRDESGEVVGAVETMADISDRKRMEDDMRKLASVVTHSNELVNLATLDGKMIYLNDAGMKMLGISADEVAQTQVMQVIPSHLVDKVQKEVLPIMMAGQSWEGDLEYKNLKNGTITPVHAMVFPVTDPQTGAPLYCANVSLDITERTRMEHALRELNATLESKVVLRTAELEHRTRQLQKLTLQLSQAEDRERTRIGAILHEDFQQQIAGAKLHLSLLNRRTKDDPQQQEIITKVDEILKDAIEQSRSLAHELSPAALSQNDLTEVLRWLAVRMNAELGLRVRVEAQEGLILESDALTVFLFRAIQEMLRNVVKHAKAADARIRTSCHGQYVCISVRDKGKGFNPEDLGETTGYGLMSIRERIEMLGGRLKIRSRKNRGTTLYLTIPNESAPTTDANLGEIVAQGK